MSEEHTGKPAACGTSSLARPDPWRVLTRFTPARIGLGRAGGSLPTSALLAFQLAHAQARDAVHRGLDGRRLAAQLEAVGFAVLELHSAARDRSEFVARPDLGRILDDDSKRLLEQRAARDGACDCALIVADGLSALAVERHAPGLLQALRERSQDTPWRFGPVALVREGRVAIGDEIGTVCAAKLTVVLIGERPGLSSPDSLGIYLTYDPVPGRSNAERNCISNVRPPAGLSYASAAHKLHYLMAEALRRRLSGVELKESATALADASATPRSPAGPAASLE